MILRAKSITWTVCEHGTLTIIFHDAKGDAFAEAIIATSNVQTFFDSIEGGIEDPEPGPCSDETVGHA